MMMMMMIIPTYKLVVLIGEYLSKKNDAKEIN